MATIIPIIIGIIVIVDIWPSLCSNVALTQIGPVTITATSHRTGLTPEF